MNLPTHFFFSYFFLLIFSNGVNNCKSGPGDNKDCSMKNNFFPAFAGNGNVCAGVEIKKTDTSNGCGCKPNDTNPCTYNPALQDEFDDRCFICTTEDLANGICPTCTACLEDCDSCVATPFQTVDEYKSCLNGMSDTCRSGCAEYCIKNPTYEYVKKAKSDKCCSMNLKTCLSSRDWCSKTEERCLGCNYAMIDKSPKCTGIPWWGACTNNHDGCCPPATCVVNSVWWAQCKVVP